MLVTTMIVLAAGMAGISQSNTTSPTAEVVAAPGSVVRWSGAQIDSCRLGERRFDPIDGACLIPVDLLIEGSASVTRTRSGRIESLTVRAGDYPYRVQRLQIKDDGYVNLSAENLERSKRERRRIEALFALETPRRFELPLRFPLEKRLEGGRFGSRRFINGEPRSPHSGADYGANRGTPVLAAGAGTVALAEEHFFAGNSVYVDHGGGLLTMYFHLDQISVAPGDVVEAGDRVGLVGNTGRSTGPHLHFGVRWHGARVDPALLLSSPTSWPAVSSP